MNEAVAPPPLPTEVSSPVTFTGVRADFRRLIMRGALLELITLGFYRFWLATDMRRHFWSHTTVDGDAPEYTGTAKELLIGFLIALAILVPIYLIYFFIGLEAERYQAFASIPLILFFFLFYQFAMYRARRYRLTRTVWRGVRFWMKGSGWAYAFLVGLWSLLVIITLGLALPWYQAALERYKMRHSFYGDLPGRFDGTGGGLFKQIWWLWLVTLVFLLAIGGAAAAIGGERGGAVAGLLGMLLMVWAVFGYAIYKACEWRWWISGIRFGEVRFESKMTSARLIDLYWIVIGWSWLILFLLIVWVGGIFGAVYALAGGQSAGPEAFAMWFQHPGVLGLIVLGYIALALAFGVVVRMYLRRDLWARVVSSTVVHNLAAADNVAARGEAANALGEGFADSFDIGGF
jgi:uncharacterized membrane protein YjgN (DUF898 family)